MDTTLKQRILGIIVVIGLLGVCLSMLLHNLHNKNAERRGSSRAKHELAIPTSSPDMNVSSTTPAILATTPSPTTASTQTQMPTQSERPPEPMTVPNPAVNPAINPAVANAAAKSPAQNLQSQFAQQTPAPATPGQSEIASLPQPQTTQATTQATTQVTTRARSAATPSRAAAATNPAISPISSTPSALSSSSAITSKNLTANTQVHEIRVTHTAAGNAGKTHRHHAQHQPVAETLKPATAKVTQGAHFAVQIGSFGRAVNAETLAKKLRAKGFVVTTQKIHTAKGEMVRVVVGKTGLDKQNAETLRADLDKNAKISGFLVPYENHQ